MARQAIGKAEHRRISGCSNGIRIRALNDQVVAEGQKGRDFRPALAGAALTAKEAHLEMGVILQQAQGLQAAIAGGSNDRDSLERRGRHRPHRLHWGWMTLVIDPLSTARAL